MKKILFIAFVIFITTSKGQTLENVYDSASVWNTCQGNTNQLMLVNFEVSGYQYVKINRCGKIICIYDLNHSLVHTIPMSSFPTGSSGIGSIIYFSETLFNTDAKKEFIYCYDYSDTHGNAQNVTRIYDENATVIFADTSAPLIITNYEQQQYPIYNTPHGTKMILSCTNGKAKVFGLKGTLSCSTPCSPGGAQITEGLKKVNVPTDNGVSNAYPNPTINTTSIAYTLPNGVNQGEVIFYNMQGVAIKHFKVDATFNTLEISTTDIEAGTYYYQLLAGGNASTAKKIVVIK